MMALEKRSLAIFYTLFSSLGDFLVMGDVVYKANKAGIKVFCLHLNNPYVNLWKYGDYRDVFFNVCSLTDWVRLMAVLRGLRHTGCLLLGAQQAPGSSRGFLFLKFLRSMNALDYVVDLNLVDADIVTCPKGAYILEVHLNQIQELSRVDFSQEDSRLILPVDTGGLGSMTKQPGRKRIGIHPWTRKAGFVNVSWPKENWVKLVGHCMDLTDAEVIFFGKDKRFDQFQKDIERAFPHNPRVFFKPSGSVVDLIQTIDSADLLFSPNSSVVHIGYALNKSMVILQGPALDIWCPKGRKIRVLKDETAVFQAGDYGQSDPNFACITNVSLEKVMESIVALW